MKLMGKISGEPVVVLIDSGASQCFVSERLARDLGMRVEPTPQFGVCFGDGHKSVSQGLCKGLVVELGTVTVEVDGYLFKLGGVDLILGVSWLETLGEVLVDWGKMTMKFWQGGQQVMIEGEPSLCYNQFLN